jgi:hypothetical protein
MPRLVPPSRILSQADARRKLGHEVWRDAVEAGVLVACCIKRTPKGKREFYRLEDVEAIEEAMARGTYPGQD